MARKCLACVNIFSNVYVELERKPGGVLNDSFFFHLGEILVTLFNFYRENTNLEDAGSE